MIDIATFALSTFITSRLTKNLFALTQNLRPSRPFTRNAKITLNVSVYNIRAVALDA